MRSPKFYKILPNFTQHSRSIAFKADECCYITCIFTSPFIRFGLLFKFYNSLTIYSFHLIRLPVIICFRNFKLEINGLITKTFHRLRPLTLQNCTICDNNFQIQTYIQTYIHLHTYTNK